MNNALDVDLVKGVHPSNIRAIISGEYLDYYYLTIKELSELRKAAYKDLDKDESWYLQDRDPYTEYHPNPFFPYQVSLSRLSNICLMLEYKCICKERYITADKRFIDSYNKILLDQIINDPHKNYLELVDQFKNVEIELIIEHYQENGKIQYKTFDNRLHNGWVII